MINWLKKHLKDIIRPVLYRAFSRTLIALTLALLWNRFVNKAGFLSLEMHAYTSIGILFLALAWFNYLRLDGIQPPVTRRRKPKEAKPRASADITDYIDQEIVPFDELAEDERVAGALLSDLICGVIFLVLSVV